MSIVVEDGTGKSTAESYITLEFANTYHSINQWASQWSSLTDAAKENALKLATRLIDQCCKFSGNKTTSTQALEFPRSACWDKEGSNTTLVSSSLRPYYLGGKGAYIGENEIPTALKQATAEMALLAISKNPNPSSVGDDSSSISSLSIPDLSISVGSKKSVSMLSSSTISLLSRYGHIPGSSGSVPVTRT